jgi:hypothetical protein
LSESTPGRLSIARVAVLGERSAAMGPELRLIVDRAVAMKFGQAVPAVNRPGRV